MLLALALLALALQALALLPLFALLALAVPTLTLLALLALALLARGLLPGQQVLAGARSGQLASSGRRTPTAARRVRLDTLMKVST